MVIAPKNDLFSPISSGLSPFHTPIFMKSFRLENGLRVVVHYHPSEVLHCGYVLCTGTRHEDAADSGMAHFIEHMSFKGTSRRRSRQVNDYLERVGGEINAFTSKQETVYSATVLRKDFSRAVDVLTDIVFHSTYPQAEIDKEVEVIIDEIDSYRDSPAELIFDEFEQLVYGDAPLGRDILGNPERLRTYTTADAVRFAKEHYVPQNAVFYVHGEVEMRTVIRQLEKWNNCKMVGSIEDSSSKNADFTEVSCDTQQEKVERKCDEIEVFQNKEEEISAIQPAAPSVRRVKRDTHQAHVMMGGLTFGSNDDRRFTLLLLNNILGGPAMNSRLNMAVREKCGLVYSIDAYLNTYPDTGFWNVYFGCDLEDVERCCKLVERELAKLAHQPLTTRQLRAAQEQLCGQIGISGDNSESAALAMAKQFAHFGTYRNIARLYDKIRAITAEELQQLAAEIYRPEARYTLIYH